MFHLKVYRICSKTVLCYPLTFETNDFYVSNDMALLLDNIRVKIYFRLTKEEYLSDRIDLVSIHTISVNLE